MNPKLLPSREALRYLTDKPPEAVHAAMGVVGVGSMLMGAAIGAGGYFICERAFTHTELAPTTQISLVAIGSTGLLSAIAFIGIGATYALNGLYDKLLPHEQNDSNYFTHLRFTKDPSPIEHISSLKVEPFDKLKDVTRQSFRQAAFVNGVHVRSLETKLQDGDPIYQRELFSALYVPRTATVTYHVSEDQQKYALKIKTNAKQVSECVKRPHIAVVVQRTKKGLETIAVLPAIYEDTPKHPRKIVKPQERTDLAWQPAPAKG